MVPSGELVSQNACVTATEEPSALCPKIVWRAYERETSDAGEGVGWAGLVVSFWSAVAANTPSATMIDATTAIATYFRFRDARCWRCSCSVQAPKSGSVLLVTISKISFSSAIGGASCRSKHGSPLRGQCANG